MQTRRFRDRVQTAVGLLYPPRCLGCGTLVASDFGLCGPCWRDTPFIAGTVCESCGVPLPGVADGDRLECDDCMAQPRPWSKGRAALLYEGRARRMVLALKHGDRGELARPAALWMANAARPLLREGMLIAPVPLHWLRFAARRYNQSALLAQHLALRTGLAQCPDLLRRIRRTQPLGHKTAQERFADLAGSVAVHPGRARHLAGRDVLLVDDVMTSGATLAACATACREAGAGEIFVITLARVAKAA
ncbi:ComF family protein [Pontibaca methylaminivorans]|uniref:ComF family protein n=1 Tax=Pontibaca methylaminivorans TaxID=515897 RepID=UPI002FDB37D7